MTAPRAWVEVARRIRERRSIVLCYHGVAPSGPLDDPGFLRVHPGGFRRQVELLIEAGFDFLPVAQFAAKLGSEGPPPGLAALSFDDGMDDNHDVLLPILKEYGLPATVYVMTGYIGCPNPFMPPESRARMMTADQLRVLVAADVEIGAHSVSHPDLSMLGREACLREMVESRETLERLTGRPVDTFAYPSCKYGPAALAAVREAGFTAAVTCHGRGGWSSYELKRSMITGKDGMASFLLKLADAYEPLFDSRPGRVSRVITRGARRRARLLAERGGRGRSRDG